MEVGVKVTGEDPMTGVKQHCLSGYLTFVAVDKNGKPAEVPKIEIDSASDVKRYEQAKKRQEIRLAERKN